MNKRFARTAVVAAACGVTVLGTFGAAFAHVEPDPAAVEAGKSATVGFGVEHGCNGSNTTGMDFQVPDGVTDAKPVDKAGWTTSVAGNVVSFSGGDLDADTPDSFQITFTAPATAGTIHFPVVQKCAEGETAWIQIAAEGAAEPDHPAPTIKVTDGPPTAEDLAGEHDDEGEGTATDGTEAGDHHDSDDDSNGAVIAIIAVAVVLVVGGGAYLMIRRRQTPPPPAA